MAPPPPACSPRAGPGLTPRPLKTSRFGPMGRRRLREDGPRVPHEIPSGSENPRRSRTRALRERRAAANRPQAFRTNDEAGPDAAPDGSTEAPLAGFSLLADPATISGGGHVASSPDRDEELDRLRSALHARSLEIERLRHRDAAAPSASSQPPPRS